MLSIFRVSEKAAKTPRNSHKINSRESNTITIMMYMYIHICTCFATNMRACFENIYLYIYIPH